MTYWTIASNLFAHERALFWTAIVGFAFGLVCFTAMTQTGFIVAPEGNLYKAATFDIALGIYLLTLVLIVPRAGMSPTGQAIWRWSLVPLSLFAFGVETIQILRGLDPRFSTAGTPLDNLIGGIFFLSALGILTSFLVLMSRFFFRSTHGPDGPLVLSLRYAAVAATAAFGIGIAMSASGGPHVEPGGNLLPLHAAGFHGLQAVPLVALLSAWAGCSPEASRWTVHGAGLAWLAACGAIAWQSFGGRPVLEMGPATLVAVACLGVWAVFFLRAAVAFHRHGAWPAMLHE